MLAQTERRRCRHGMTVVRGTDNHCVNIALFQQLAEIMMSPRCGKPLFSRGEEFFVYVANGDNVFAFHASDIFGRAMGRADNPNV